AHSSGLSPEGPHTGSGADGGARPYRDPRHHSRKGACRAAGNGRLSIIPATRTVGEIPSLYSPHSNVRPGFSPHRSLVHAAKIRREWISIPLTTSRRLIRSVHREGFYVFDSASIMRCSSRPPSFTL